MKVKVYMHRWDSPSFSREIPNMLFLTFYFLPIHILKCREVPQIKGWVLFSLCLVSGNISSFTFDLRTKFVVLVGIGALISWGLSQRPWTWLRVRMEGWWPISDILYVLNIWSRPWSDFFLLIFVFGSNVCRLWRSRNPVGKAAVKWVVSGVSYRWADYELFH